MIITNNLNLPQALVNAVSPDPHNKPDELSATTLKQGAKEILLTKRHWNEITKDVSEMIWALWGTTAHSLLENESDNTFVEEKFCEPFGKYTVTGRVDCYDMKEEILYDYKTTSAWKIVFKKFEDWKAQGLIYAYLLFKKGLKVKECRFIALIRDFSEKDALTKEDYPKCPVYVYSFKVTDEMLKEIEQSIKDKVEEVISNEDKNDDDIPPCTETERWAEKTKYAVMKTGRKSAVRVLEDKGEAEKLAEVLGKGHSVEERKGTDKKCTKYCSCCNFCNYYKEHYAGNE